MTGTGAALRAAGLYAASVFAAGFVLGTVRVLALEPAFGRATSVLAEIPLMLALSWVACRWTMRPVPPALALRGLAGAVAFLLLMGAEAVLSIAVLGRTAPTYLGALLDPAEAPGLLAQVAFGLFPLLEARFRRSG